MTKLEVLDIALCEGVRDAGLVHLRGLTGLRESGQRGCTGCRSGSAFGFRICLSGVGDIFRLLNDDVNDFGDHTLSGPRSTLSL